MKIRTFAVLFLCHAVPLFIGMGLFPILPFYAAQFGATRTDIGLFYAIVYIASVTSVLGTGWLAARVSRRRLFLFGAALGSPTMLLLGHATELWHVVLLTSLAWVSGGITLTLLGVFTGILAEPASRGRVFGLLFLVYPIDALVGGLTVGQLTAAYGYTLMFLALAAIWLIQPVVGWFALRDPRITQSPPRQETRGAAPLGRPFALLLAATLLAMVCTSVGRLGVSLAMQSLGFGPDGVGITATISGLVTILFVLLFGILSDRLGRLPLLLLSYLLAVGGVITLIGAAQLWHFQLAATLLLVAWCVIRAAASALAADMLPPELLAIGLPRLSAMDSLASIAAFAATGYAMDVFGPTALFAVGAALGLVAAVALAVLYQAGAAQRRGVLSMDAAGAVAPLPAPGGTTQR